MAADRGDNLGAHDQLAIAQSARAAQARGTVLTPELAREYATRALLGLEECVAIMQGLAPLLVGTLAGPTYLDQHELAVKRLLHDVANGNLRMPCRPFELDQWAKSSHVELAQAFRAHLPQSDLPFRDDLPQSEPSQTPPPAKVAPDQQARIDCQQIAIEIWKLKPLLSIANMLSERRIAAYTNGYKHDTVRKWLSMVDPRPPERKPGPRRKSG